MCGLINKAAFTAHFRLHVMLLSKFVGVHSEIRVHLIQRGRNSLYTYPRAIGTKCTSNAFFFHAEDEKNIFISLLHFGGGKLAAPFATAGL